MGHFRSIRLEGKGLAILDSTLDDLLVQVQDLIAQRPNTIAQRTATG